MSRISELPGDIYNSKLKKNRIRPLFIFAVTYIYYIIIYILYIYIIYILYVYVYIIIYIYI